VPFILHTTFQLFSFSLALLYFAFKTFSNQVPKPAQETLQQGGHTTHKEENKTHSTCNSSSIAATGNKKSLGFASP
jgi:hypothetical protein